MSQDPFGLFEEDGLGDLVPDTIPDWLSDLARKHNRNLSKYKPLGEHFKATEVVQSDKFDRKHFTTMRDNVTDLNDIAINRWVDDPSWFDLIRDEFLGLYKAAPEFNKANDMKPTHRINHAALDKAMKQRDWSELRTYTELDQWASAMAAVEFAIKLGEIYDELKELREKQDNMVDQDQKVGSIIDQLEQAQDDMDKAEKLLDDLEHAMEPYADAIGGITDQLKQDGPKVRQAAKQAAQQGKEDAEAVAESIEMFGTEPGALQRMDPTARMELARRIQGNRRLRELAEKVGRFVRLAMAEQAQKIVHGTDEVYDVELGNNINRTLPAEFMNLADEDLEVLFLAKYIENQLMQYKLRGAEKVARGAIICLIDSSGSMNGSRDTWAKAVGIALLNIAARQKRDFYGIIFSSGYDPLKEFYFPKGLGAPNDVLDFAEFFYGGGTDFERPLTRAVEVLETQFNDEGSQKGDIVMITDGECYTTDEFKEAYRASKEQTGFRTYSCLIGSYGSELQALSDEVYNITELARGDDVSGMFSGI